MNSEKALEDIQEQSLLNGEFMCISSLRSICGMERIVGAEALVRWANPEKGFMLPNLFIPLLKETGLLSHLIFMFWKKFIKMIHDG